MADKSKKPTKEVQPHPKEEFEFGGAPGVALLMLGFPGLMYYMYIGAVFYGGHLPTPDANQTWPDFVSHLGNLAYTHAFPHRKAWIIYWTFLILEGVGYLYLPGVYGKGKPLPHLNGKQLGYYCSAVSSWCVTIIAALALHFSGLFKLYTLVDEFGPLMSVAICSGFLVSIIAYLSALARGVQHRMTGSHVYDFFMGAELNPRLFGWLDFKMFFEVRIPWYILFLLTLGTALKQFETYGFVSGEVLFLLMAHFLYANACSKGEELIITSWYVSPPMRRMASPPDTDRDMYYEKWGFMLIFWNLAGVPMSYCHCTLYLAYQDPSAYHWNPMVLAVWAVAYLFVYWVWDTCNSQKNIFRAQERGVVVDRKAFPQLPWKSVKNPQSIRTKTGDSILCSGWYGMARKVHYSCDLFFALSWGLVTGFQSPFPWFYPCFFTVMIIHRAKRDILRCRERYGEAWMEYERRVPYLFIPVCVLPHLGDN
ncbi:c-24(28) sterol reductase [Aspergillus clavatus NRRL 1]|uniref:Delta(24(24(1)))-sterol reductase n=1 Tax=Aspergillus clavatus (strain ATCC 1007 / CBS 513.65 / DSM 816 / NCTC 3887 / NRRL 1 / QM 1276 / 107) TaxID=344612 RepID=A1CC10_ASPCL|nr:C-24(28) sterol reductase [Aspergillus clavatus NRRL 1]EAW13278.1 C-24(28) sterol reductase [Aspergillus clavatus NRRL 1]